MFRYSLGKKLQFQLADGNPRPIKTDDSEGTITFSCTDRSLEVVSRGYGSTIPYRVKMTPVGDDQILVEETNVLRSGIYKRGGLILEITARMSWGKRAEACLSDPVAFNWVCRVCKRSIGVQILIQRCRPLQLPETLQNKESTALRRRSPPTDGDHARRHARFRFFKQMPLFTVPPHQDDCPSYRHRTFRAIVGQSGLRFGPPRQG